VCVGTTALGTISTRTCPWPISGSWPCLLCIISNEPLCIHWSCPPIRRACHWRWLRPPLPFALATASTYVSLDHWPERAIVSFLKCLHVAIKQLAGAVAVPNSLVARTLAWNGSVRNGRDVVCVGCRSQHSVGRDSTAAASRSSAPILDTLWWNVSLGILSALFGRTL
jgi:hypothetical protein